MKRIIQHKPLKRTNHHRKLKKMAAAAAKEVKLKKMGARRQMIGVL